MPLYTHQPRPYGTYRDNKGSRFEIISADHDKETFGGGLATLKRDGQARIAVNGWKQVDSLADYAVSAGLTPVNAAGLSPSDASAISYSNAVSMLAATSVQAAIDEVEARVDGLEATAGSPSSVTDNGDGTFTHDDGQGGTITWDSATGSVVDNGDGTYTFDNGTDPAVTWGPDANTYGSVTDNGDGTFTFDNGVDPAITWGPDNAGTITDNGDGTFTWDDGNGTTHTWATDTDANDYGNVTDNGDDTFTFDNGVDPAVTWDTSKGTVMVGDTGAGGEEGTVPAPATGDATKYLRGDGTWAAIPVSGSAVLTDNNNGTFDFDNGTDPVVTIDYRAPEIVVDPSNFPLTPGPLVGTTTDVQAALELLDAATGPMIGAGASSAGQRGLVPDPVAGDNELFLRGDGRWEQAGLTQVDISAGAGVAAGDAAINLAPGEALSFEAGAGITLTGNDAVNQVEVSGSDFTGATAVTPGTAGMVVQPAAGDQDSFLAGNGAWVKGPTDFVRGSTLVFEPTDEPLTRQTIMAHTSSSFFRARFDVSKTDANTNGIYVARILRNSDSDFPIPMEVSWTNPAGGEKVNGVAGSTASIPVKPGSREAVVIFDWATKDAYAYFV